MYKGDKKNVEEYLTGKRIDDAITRELVTEEIPNSTSPCHLLIFFVLNAIPFLNNFFVLQSRTNLHTQLID